MRYIILLTLVIISNLYSINSFAENCSPGYSFPLTSDVGFGDQYKKA